MPSSQKSKQKLKTKQKKPSNSLTDNKPAKSVSSYELLFRLNQSCSEALEIIQQFVRERYVPRNEAAYYCAFISQARASASQTVVEHLSGKEIENAGKADRDQVAMERKLFGRTGSQESEISD